MEQEVFIQVDRLVRPEHDRHQAKLHVPSFGYPSWIEMTLHPELECTGPGYYGALDLVEYKFPQELRLGAVRLAHLEEHRLLDGCIGLRDQEEIAKLGGDFYHYHFGYRELAGWKSAVVSRFGGVFIPLLVTRTGQLTIRWLSVSEVVEPKIATFRFKVVP